MMAPCSPKQEKIIATAKSWLGTPYHHQASLKHIGTDCLGLLRGVWRELYGHEPELPPPYSRDWAERKGAETLYQAASRHMAEVALSELLPGDVLLFRWRGDSPAKHCGVLVSQSHMIHAYEGHGVVQAALSGWWQRHLSYGFRLPDFPIFSED